MIFMIMLSYFVVLVWLVVSRFRLIVNNLA